MASVSCPPPPAHTSAAGPAEDAPGGGPGGGWRWGSFRASSPLLQAVTRGSASRSDNALYEHTRTAMALGDLASGVPSGGVHVSKAPAVVAHVASDRVCTASSAAKPTAYWASRRRVLRHAQRAPRPARDRTVRRFCKARKSLLRKRPLLGAQLRVTLQQLLGGPRGTRLAPLAARGVGDCLHVGRGACVSASRRRARDTARRRA